MCIYIQLAKNGSHYICIQVITMTCGSVFTVFLVTIPTCGSTVMLWKQKYLITGNQVRATTK